MQNGRYAESLSDIRQERRETILERSIAARRRGHGQVRTSNKFGAASKMRRLNDTDRRAVENELRGAGRL